MSELRINREFRYKTHTIRYGVQGEGPPLVAVHGTPWSSYNLRHLIDGLSDTHTVYFYDLLGYGSSDKPDADVSLGVQNDILAALIDHWGLSEPVALGHDYGGATLLRAAVLYRIPLERLVLIDPVAISPWGSEFLRHVMLPDASLSVIDSAGHLVIEEKPKRLLEEISGFLGD